MKHPAEQHFAAWLIDTQARAAEHGHGVFLTADQSGLPRLREARPMLQALACRNILSSAPECDLDGASPLLIQVSGVAQVLVTKLARWLFEQARYANCVSVIVTPLGIDVLHGRLRQRTEIMLPGNMQMVLRYFDTRTLPLLPRLLSPEQYAAFRACAAEWHYLDRGGDVRQLPTPVFAFVGEFAAPLEVSAAQEQMLIDDGLADSVIDQLLDLRPPALSSLTPPQQYERIAPLVAAALEWGLNDTMPALQFVDTALNEGDDFATREPWASRLAAHRRGQLGFSEALRIDA